MRLALVVAITLVFAGGCRRHHNPPDWQPSLAQPVAPRPAPPSLPLQPPPMVYPPPLPPPPPPAAPPPAAAAAPGDGGALAVARSAIPVPIPDGGSVNGDPRGPTAEALNDVIRGATPALQRCLDAAPDLPLGVDLRTTVSYHVVGAGKAENVNVQGPLPPAAAACVRAAVEGLRFPAFEGRPVDGNFPFSYRRDPGPGEE